MENSWIEFWKKELNLQDIEVITQPISREQVTFPNDISEEDKFFIGVAHEEKTATIYHDRELTEEDILHELLHVAFPSKSEQWVVKQTEKRLQWRKNK
jgi:hypothetical protein